MINTLHTKLDIPITAKMRVLETRERTLEYAKMILSAGASILTVHGRQREQKGHKTGLADWSMIKYLRDNLPSETVMFANGNILQHDDIEKCLETTGVDGVMSAEGNLYDPSIFVAAPPASEHEREYWRGRDGKGGYRCDAVVRRYFDIIYKHVLRQDPPERSPLWMPGDPVSDEDTPDIDSDGPPPTKKQKRAVARTENTTKHERPADVNMTAMQGHMFNILRALVKEKTDVRDQLARTRAGDMEGFENVLQLVEHAVREGITAYNADPAQFNVEEPEKPVDGAESDPETSSRSTVRRCRRPWFVCQPYVRLLPAEAIVKGSLKLSKKELAKLRQEEEDNKRLAAAVGVAPDGTTEKVSMHDSSIHAHTQDAAEHSISADTNGTAQDNVEIPREGLVCG